MHVIILLFIAVLFFLAVAVLAVQLKKGSHSAGRAPANTSLDDRLKNLERLKEQGLVSDAEYQTKRQQLLAEL
jgi:cytochrome c-type biogenesis protein CcmH/NrfG